jgi:hypothetical protein
MNGCFLMGIVDLEVHTSFSRCKQGTFAAVKLERRSHLQEAQGQKHGKGSDHCDPDTDLSGMHKTDICADAFPVSRHQQILKSLKMLVPLWLCLVAGLAGIFIGYLVHNFLQAFMATLSFAGVILFLAWGVAYLKSRGVDIAATIESLADQWNLL